MFTLAIGGRAIAVTNADRAQAQELFDSEEFREDLVSLESEGKPLWDGRSPIEVRQSTPEEIEEFEDALDEDDDDDAEPANDDGEDDEEGLDVLFLVPIDGMGDQAASA